MLPAVAIHLAVQPQYYCRRIPRALTGCCNLVGSELTAPYLAGPGWRLSWVALRVLTHRQARHFRGEIRGGRNKIRERRAMLFHWEWLCPIAQHQPGGTHGYVGAVPGQKMRGALVVNIDLQSAWIVAWAQKPALQAVDPVAQGVEFRQVFRVGDCQRASGSGPAHRTGSGVRTGTVCPRAVIADCGVFAAKKVSGRRAVLLPVPGLPARVG